MAQFIFEQFHELTLMKYIEDVDNIKNINIQLRSSWQERFNVLTINIALPQTLIQIIDAYVVDVFNILISRHNICTRHNQMHMHFNFDTDSFESTCCIKFRNPRIYYSTITHDSCGAYNSVLNTFITDNEVLKYKIFHNKKHKYSKKLSQQQKILKTHFKQVNNYFKAYHNCNNCTNTYCNICVNAYRNICIDNDDHVDFDQMLLFDSALFFNCYSMNTQQIHNTIKYIPSGHKKHNDGNIYITEDCTYNNKTDCYKQIVVTNKTSKMMQYKIINHKRFTDILVVNKILYEFIDTLMKQMCYNATLCTNYIMS